MAKLLVGSFRALRTTAEHDSTFSNAQSWFHWIWSNSSSNLVTPSAIRHHALPVFVESLFPLSFPAANALGQHLGLSKLSAPASVLDIGTGSGVWGITLAKQSPHMRIHAVDWPQVLRVTKRVARKHGVASRLTTAPGDFFAADFGKGHRLATIGHILHSEGRERSQRLLKKVFAALAPGGTVAIQEFIPDEGRTGPAAALIFAVNMHVNTEAGDTYTFSEMSQWLRQAGFKNPRLLDVPSVSPLILADKQK